jgi:hypothetical protein
MKKTILPRLIAAMTAAVVSLSLLEAVATMGQGTGADDAVARLEAVISTVNA